MQWSCVLAKWSIYVNIGMFHAAVISISQLVSFSVPIHPSHTRHWRKGLRAAVVAPNYHFGGQFLPVLGQCDSGKDVAALHNAVKNGKDFSSGYEKPFIAVPPLLAGKGLEKGREGRRLQGCQDSER